MSDVRYAGGPNRRQLLLAGAGGIAACASGLSPAGSQPVQGTARVLVGFPAGGPSDVTARLLAEHIKGYASAAIVENRPGAGGRVDKAALALVVGRPDLALEGERAPATLREPPFDPVHPRKIAHR
jgi:tripartite-type tricarboxylate transporter receptor subunit TctC